jgi:undecaprenyl-phosphate galactose phosphotransferase
MEGKDLAQADIALEQLMRENIPYSISPPLKNLPVYGMESHYFFNRNVMLLTRNNRIHYRSTDMLKRCLDIVGASLALALLSWLLLIVAVIIKGNGGDIFFTSKRVGKHGKIFDCIKFRSMVPNADAVLATFLKRNPGARTEWQTHKKLRRYDPRHTRAGRILRHYSIDELPQLINVLRGEMSLVGPRPILPSERTEYGEDIAYYYRLRPGITGLWQVSGRNNVSYRQRVEMDKWYARNWSWWHDIAILFKTFPAIIKRTGAY